MNNMRNTQKIVTKIKNAKVLTQNGRIRKKKKT